MREDLRQHRGREYQERGAALILGRRLAVDGLVDQLGAEANARQVDPAVGDEAHLDLLLRHRGQLRLHRDRAGLVGGHGLLEDERAVLQHWTVRSSVVASRLTRLPVRVAVPPNGVVTGSGRPP